MALWPQAKTHFHTLSSLVQHGLVKIIREENKRKSALKTLTLEHRKKEKQKQDYLTLQDVRDEVQRDILDTSAAVWTLFLGKRKKKRL